MNFLPRTIEPRNHFGGAGFDSMAEADKDVDCWGVFAAFEHTDVFARPLCERTNFLLGETSPESQFAEFCAKHAGDANRDGMARL
jgi:hypothetical protein